MPWTIDRECYDAALAFANQILSDLGYPPASELPLSIRGNARECAIARAVKSRAPAVSIAVGGTQAHTENRTWDMPPLVKKFIQQFDGTQAPQEVQPLQCVVPQVPEGAAAKACGCVLCMKVPAPSLTQMLEAVALHDPSMREAALARMGELSDTPQGLVGEPQKDRVRVTQ